MEGVVGWITDAEKNFEFRKSNLPLCAFAPLREIFRFLVQATQRERRGEQASMG